MQECVCDITQAPYVAITEAHNQILAVSVAGPAAKALNTVCAARGTDGVIVFTRAERRPSNDTIEQAIVVSVVNALVG